MCQGKGTLSNTTADSPSQQFTTLQRSEITMPRRLFRGKVSSKRSLFTIAVLLWTRVFLGTCVEKVRPGGSSMAVEISRRPRYQDSLGVIEANRRRLSGSEGGKGVVDVQDCDNIEYSGRIGLGTPMQEFEVVLDTGSYHLWVTSAACSKNCDTSNKYNSSASTTYEPDGRAFSQHYQDGSKAKGVLSVDSLSLGGLTTRVNFGEVTKRSLDGCMGVDGVMGMGLSRSGSGKNAFETLVDAGVVDVPVFAFFMGDVDTDMPTGVLTLGGVNQTHYEDCLRWVSLSNHRVDDYWSVHLNKLKIGDVNMLRSEAITILDTGASMIFGPYDDVGYLADALGGWCAEFASSGSSSVVQVDCALDSGNVQMIVMPCSAEFEDLTFQLGRQEFTLTASELLLPLADFDSSSSTTSADPACMFGMLGHDKDWWVLGDTFLRTFYTAYDVEEQKVGFAKATANRVGETCIDDIIISADVSDPSHTSPPSSTDDASVSEATYITAQVVPTTPAVDPTSTTSEDVTSFTSWDNTSGISPIMAETELSEEVERPRQTLAMAVIAFILAFIAMITCCGIGVLVQRRIRRGTTRRHIQLDISGKGGEGLEMAGNGAEATVVGDADDLLQANPVNYRGSGSGSHRYRIAAETVAGKGGRTSVGVTLLENHRPMVVDDDEEEEDDDAAGSVTPTGRLGMFGRRMGAVIGFTPFGDGEKSSGQQQSGEQAHLV